jgi:hypothetical protein
MSTRANRPSPKSQSVPENQSSPAAKPEGCAPTLVRLAWILGGNILLFFLAISIMKRQAFSVFDAFYWATVAALIVLRYIDISKLHGETANGEPASMRHWVRYVVLLFVVSAGLWGLAHTGPVARFLAP